jgi:hypothetical protein
MRRREEGFSFRTAANARREKCSAVRTLLIRVDLAEFNSRCDRSEQTTMNRGNILPARLAPEDKMQSGQEAWHLSGIIAEFPEASERLMQPLEL